MEEHHGIELLAVRPKTVARILDCGLTSVYEMIKTGELRTIPFGSDQRVLMADVRKLAQKGWPKVAA